MRVLSQKSGENKGGDGVYIYKEIIGVVIYVGDLKIDVLIMAHELHSLVDTVHYFLYHTSSII